MTVEEKLLCETERYMEKETASRVPAVRFLEFDLLKAIAIVGLPMVHILEELAEIYIASPELLSLMDVILVLCAFGPTVFMICMGFGIGGGKTSAKSIKQTGLQFLIIGFLLNVVRWLLPGVITGIVLGESIMEDVCYLFASDIYFFVGLFYLFYAFLKKHKISTVKLIFISIVMLMVNGILTPVMTGLDIPRPISDILGNIVYVDEISCFPLLSWAIFPSFGILLGEILKSRDEEYHRKFSRSMVLISAAVFVSFGLFLWSYGLDVAKILVSPANDYITDVPNVILLLSLAGVVIGLMQMLSQKIANTGFTRVMLTLATYMIPFYIIQWILIAWTGYFLEIFRVPYGAIGILIYVILVVVITAISIYISLNYGMKIMRFIIKYTTPKFKKKKKGTAKS